MPGLLLNSLIENYISTYHRESVIKVLIKTSVVDRVEIHFSDCALIARGIAAIHQETTLEACLLSDIDSIAITRVEEQTAYEQFD